MKIKAKVGVAFGEPGTGTWDTIEVFIPAVAGEQVEHYAIVEAMHLIEAVKSEGATLEKPVAGYFLIEHKHVWEEGE